MANIGSMIWADEMKLELYSPRDVAFVWREKGESYNPKITVLLVNYVDESIILQYIELGIL